ncbi:unnamed protein product [Nippostrongylus brasiliensis]|uniref:Uncharacterized protein n=1 Tax=Nippostrongylus brasiliensis TaxID=27835 RepID=A0A158QXJ8_NIPBR|nr:unnamed protein product [Nippostrongylus brasiliensis]
MALDLKMAFIYTATHGYPYASLYDCSSKTLDEWYATGSVEWVLGLYFLITGIFIEILYFLCMIAMWKQNLLVTSCYKIMFFLGFLDISSLFVNSIATGYFAIRGAVFCTNPVLLLTMGAFGCACWCASCLTCIFLALNRCADVSENVYLRVLFDGSRVYLLMFLSFLYLLFIMFFTTPASFNSNYVSWFFNPMTGQESHNYVNSYHAINNVIVAITTPLLYFYLCTKLFLKTRNSASKVGRVQKQIFLQAFLICMINVVAAYIYVYMQYFTPSKWLVIVGQIAWQLSAGFVCLIYIVVNRTIRRGVICLVVPTRWQPKFQNSLAPTSFASHTRAQNRQTSSQM